MEQFLTSRTAGESLNYVRAAIPESFYRRSKPRAIIALAQATVLYAIPLVGLILTNTWWMLLILWLLADLAVAGLFVLGHDASHSALFDWLRTNRFAARLSVASRDHLRAAWDLRPPRNHLGYTHRPAPRLVSHPLALKE